MFAELQIKDAGSKAPVAIWGHPGTAPFANTGKGPVLAFTTMGGLVYAVTSSGFYRIDSKGVATYLGATSVSVNGCSIDNNGKVICWVDGISGYYWSAAAGVVQITHIN